MESQPTSAQPGRASFGKQELPWLRGVAAALAGHSNADDLVQDTWLAAARSVAPPRSRLPWLRRILRNNLRMSWRSSERRRAREQAAHVVLEAPDVEAQAHAAEVLGQLRRHVAGLCEDQQRLLELRAAGLSASEVGRLLGIPEATARTRTHRVVKRLRAAMDEHYGDRER